MPRGDWLLVDRARLRRLGVDPADFERRVKSAGERADETSRACIVQCQPEGVNPVTTQTQTSQNEEYLRMLQAQRQASLAQLGGSQSSALSQMVGQGILGQPVQGTKHDGAKPDLTLCPLSALVEMARAFMLGEKKYSRGNYKKGMDGHRYLAAALRHIYLHEQGEDLDPESVERGMPASHLGCALASIAMYVECRRLGTLKDTRYQQKQGGT